MSDQVWHRHFAADHAHGVEEREPVRIFVGFEMIKSCELAGWGLDGHTSVGTIVETLGYYPYLWPGETGFEMMAPNCC
jgi:hypothetical protein